jgi:transcriptional regulator with XRE-family HTH domain
MNSMVETVGQRLRRIRQKQGLSQRGLGRLAKLSDASVCRIENGHSDPPLGTWARIAAALGVSLRSLVGGMRA